MTSNKMTDEFNLSEKIHRIKPVEMPTIAFNGMTASIPLRDVKEFIRLLKEEYMKYRDSFKTLEDYYRIFDDIDKLAGEKLV
jgi:hypothetical protein